MFGHLIAPPSPSHLRHQPLEVRVVLIRHVQQVGKPGIENAPEKVTFLIIIYYIMHKL